MAEAITRQLMLVAHFEDARSFRLTRVSGDLRATREHFLQNYKNFKPASEGDAFKVIPQQNGP